MHNSTKDYKEKNFILEYMPMMITHFSVENLLYYTGEDGLSEILCMVTNVNRDNLTITYTENESIHIKTVTKKDIKKYLRPIPLNIENVENYLNIKFEEDTSYKVDDIRDFYDVKSHQLRLRETSMYVNRGDYTENPCMSCHVDNFAMDSIGSGDFMYIHEYQNFIASLGLDIDIFKNNE